MARNLDLRMSGDQRGPFSAHRALSGRHGQAHRLMNENLLFLDGEIRFYRGNRR